MKHEALGVAIALGATFALALTNCAREEPKLRDPGGNVPAQATPMVSLHPGEAAAPRDALSARSDHAAFANLEKPFKAQGKRRPPEHPSAGGR